MHVTKKNLEIVIIFGVSSSLVLFTSSGFGTVLGLRGFLTSTAFAWD